MYRIIDFMNFCMVNFKFICGKKMKMENNIIILNGFNFFRKLKYVYVYVGMRKVCYIMYIIISMLC